MDFSVPDRPRKPVLAHAFEALMHRCIRRNLRPDSITTYQMHWRRVSRDLGGDRPLSSFRARELQAWLDALRRSNLALTTVQTYRRYVGMLFNVAIQAELFRGSNPIERTDPVPRGIQQPRRRLTDAEVTALFRVLQTNLTYFGKLWATVFGIMLVTGLRIRETVLLRWEDFMWDKGLLKPSHQKRPTADDILLISPELERILSTWGNGSMPSGLIFPESGKVQSRNFCGRAVKFLKRVARRAGLTDPDTVSSHVLRRTFIANAADAAAGDYLALMEVSRHRDLDVMRVYMPTLSRAVRAVSLAAARSAGVAIGLTPKASDDEAQ